MIFGVRVFHFLGSYLRMGILAKPTNIFTKSFMCPCDDRIYSCFFLFFSQLTYVTGRTPSDHLSIVTHDRTDAIFHLGCAL